MFKTIIDVSVCIVTLIGSILIANNNWKRYIVLYLSSSIIGILLCYGFVFIGFYFFPFRIFPVPIPLLEMITVLPFIVIASVHYSPSKWGYKIPFYWAIVHIIMFFEVLSLYRPLKFIDYRTEWDVWDSYTWWWIYLLIFEYVGGAIIPQSCRNPIDSEQFCYGKVLWVVIHFILISTIFLAGVYVGNIMGAK